MDPTVDTFKLGLYFGDLTADFASPTGWTEITQVEDCQPPESTIESTATHHLKTPNRFKTKKRGWEDASECEATVQYDADQYADLVALKGVQKRFKVLFADEGTTHDGGVGFEGFISKCSLQPDAEGIVKIALSITVGDAPVAIAPATGA